MKKSINYFFLLLLLTTCIYFPNVKAMDEIGYVNENNIPFTSKPNIASPTRNDYVAPGTLHLLDKGDEIKVVGNSVQSTVNSCKSSFYQVSHTYVKNGKTYTGYICGDYLTFEVDSNKYAEEFTKAGFPKSYWKYLTILKDEHPNWNFKAFQTGIDWNHAIENEAIPGKSLIHINNSGNGGYLDTSSTSYNFYTDVFQARDSSTWYAANRQAVEYYMDPRNFLSEIYVFMFEDLTYVPNIHTKDVVEKTLGSTYLKQFTDYFLQAASTHNVSPVHLAARVRQEVGANGGTVTSGAAFDYNGKTYSNLYNFYNIGATSGLENWKYGLIWANGGENQTNKTYGRPWNTPEKSILGGAEFLAKEYISIGQSTQYFQKWNVVTNNPFTHQYMTNIMAPMSEATTSFNSYRDLGLIQSGNNGSPFTFTIPVYNNMPNEKAVLPATGNPNNYLKNLTVNGKTVDSFDGGKTEYTVYVAGNSVEVGATTVNSSAQFSGTGTVILNNRETIRDITVTAGNGNQRTYRLKLIRTDGGEVSIPDVISQAGIRMEEGKYLSLLSLNQSIEQFKNQIKKVYGGLNITVKDSNGTLKSDTAYIGTGDIIEIECNGQKQKYNALIYGDVDGNGKLDLTDILYIQRHYLRVNGYQLTGVYYKAGDVDRSWTIDLSDLLQFQRQYLHLGTIAQ